MASTAIHKEEEKTEYFDSPEVLDQKCAKLAQLIKDSKHFVGYTGAGISTGCGIADYRSGYNTCMPTGPGGWEKAALKKEYKKKAVQVPMTGATPSDTHMAFVELQNRGHLKYMVSQNVDGLHRLSGIHAHNLSDVHGNMNVERCEKCKFEQVKDGSVKNRELKNHYTGRTCPQAGCNGKMRDTIINFGENCDENVFDLAQQSHFAADLCLAMGSSMRLGHVTPMPIGVAQRGGNLVIINLQKTPIDKHANMIIHGKCDEVMRLVMKKLNYQIPKWQMTRKLRITDNKNEVVFAGVDTNGAPYDFIKGISVTGLNKQASAFTNKGGPVKVKYDGKAKSAHLKISFYGKRQEKDIQFKIDMEAVRATGQNEFDMVFNPQTRLWEVVIAYDKSGEVMGFVEFK